MNCPDRKDPMRIFIKTPPLFSKGIEREEMRPAPFANPPGNRYFEDYIAGAVHEFGSIRVDEQEVLDFGKRYVPLSYHTDKEAAKNSIYGGLIASGWHTAALMMRVYTDISR